MMKSIVEEKLVSFKSLEKKVFAYICELGREMTRIMLESYDEGLAKKRDKQRYRNKGKRTTTIKTVYGEVTYARRVYQTRLEDGRTAHVYLLDEAMHMDKIGLISTNPAEKIAMTVTESPYRVTAEMIRETCGQNISHGGYVEPGTKTGRTDQQGRGALRKTDGSRPFRRNRRSPGIV